MFKHIDIFLQEKLIARPCFYRESIQDDRKPAIYLEGTDDLGTEVHISLSAYMPKTEKSGLISGTKDSLRQRKRSPT